MSLKDLNSKKIQKATRLDSETIRIEFSDGSCVEFFVRGKLRFIDGVHHYEAQGVGFRTRKVKWTLRR
jgi:hypothetical protein